jgi:glycosyltransferase involved in cell wall biosynthesis
MPMKIAFVIRHFWKDKLTCLSRTGYEISKYLAQRGDTVTIITDREANPAGEMSLSNGILLKPCRNIRETLKRERFDLVNFFGSLTGASIMLEREKLPYPIFLNMYSTRPRLKDLQNLKPLDFMCSRTLLCIGREVSSLFLPNFLLKSQFSLCQKVILQSRSSVHFYKEMLPREKIVRIPHGVDFNRFANVKTADALELRQKLGFKPRDKIIMYLGHSYTERGVDDLIDAMRLLIESGSPAKLLLVLNEMPSSPLHFIINQARTKIAFESLRVITSYVKNPEEYFAMADIVALPYRFELDIPDYPFVLLEAMASGKPTITTPLSAIPEIVKHKSTGLLVYPKDVPAIAFWIQALINDSTLATEIGRNARCAMRQFDWRLVTEKLVKCYEEASL